MQHAGLLELLVSNDNASEQAYDASRLVGALSADRPAERNLGKVLLVVFLNLDAVLHRAHKKPVIPVAIDEVEQERAENAEQRNESLPDHCLLLLTF